MSSLQYEEAQTSSFESKHYNMKQFIVAVREYAQTRAEDTAGIINRHLQLLSVTIDLSTFDPHTSVVSEFFVSLHELLSSLEPRSAIAWCCVNVLSVACRNPAARTALIHTYQFLPPLSRLLGDHLTKEKKIRLLSLMQELTCGIKISWQIPHLPHLMLNLTRWVESQEDEIVTVSLGVLVNLCYKNLPAIYTLSRCVDIKKFVRLCMPLQGLKIEVHVCKLLIILDYMNGKVPEAALLKLIEVTFKSMTEAFKAKDSILMRHIVEFFLDVRQQNQMDILNFENYDVEVQRLLQVLEKNNKSDSGDTTEHDPECMSLIFEFLHSLVELKLPKLEALHPRLINAALKWVQTELVCSQALAILRTIAVNTVNDEDKVLEPMLAGLPIFLLALDNGEEEIPTNIEYNKRIGALMQLLRSLVQAEGMRGRVLRALREETLYKVFIPLLGSQSSRNRASGADTYSNEAIQLYVNAVALVVELAKHDVEWVNLHTSLMKQKQIHMILAQALYGGSQEVKTLIMQMASTPMFPSIEMATAMSELQPLIQADFPSEGSSDRMSDSLCFPVMSVAQMERLDEVMCKLKECCSQNNLFNVSTSDVMELYEYKLASMGHAERAATASMEAASHRCTHLQHRTAQLTAELSRLHQLLFHVQQCHEDAIKTRDALSESNKELVSKLDAEKGRCKVTSSQLSVREKTLQDKELLLEETRLKLKQVENVSSVLDEQNTDLKRIVAKLEENLIRKEKITEKKEELLNRANSSIEMFKIQIVQLESKLKRSETELISRTQELRTMSHELEARRKIIETITQLANSHQSGDSKHDKL